MKITFHNDGPGYKIVKADGRMIGKAVGRDGKAWCVYDLFGSVCSISRPTLRELRARLESDTTIAARMNRQ